MRCKQARKLFIESLDHPLGAEDQQIVHAHITECAECRRFAEAMHLWPAPSVGQARAQQSPDLTERVLANVRPLPPPWVYRQEQQRRHVPQLVAFTVGALGVTLTFLMLCLTLVVVASGQAPDSGRKHSLLVPEVWGDVQSWMNTIPNDTAHTAVTLAAFALFVALVVAWFRTLAVRVGRDRH